MVRKKSGPPSRQAYQGHDHERCIAEALETADALCARREVRLTKLRRRVLELVWTSHAPIGAYDVLRRLSQEHDGAAPPTVYRALDFLLEQGLIHRIESLNAFVGCADPAEAHASQFLICQDCGAAAELQDPAINRALARSAGSLGFLVKDKTVELRGLCAQCRESQA
ncbi:MAG: Fur family transcriptional regulator [Kiloniellales bacterium]|nr:Fur family transcriptional regulator [Kiloniellales bacterium]MDJ0982051.1 Fur family transcriptional regulator [Kiloniellales bacterium]